MKSKIKKSFLVFIITFIFSITCVGWAQVIEKGIIADFTIGYLYQGNQDNVTNNVLPELIGSFLPYTINCISHFKEGESYEWYVKEPGSEYVLVDTTPNPMLQINSYGITYIKLKINGKEELSKECWVATKDFNVIKDTKIVSKKQFNAKGDFYSVKTVVNTMSTYPDTNKKVLEDSKDLKEDQDTLNNSDFTIFHNNEEHITNVTDSNIKEVVPELPYKVCLTNMGDDSDFTWYIKLPGSDYIWMDNTQNAIATIYQYGTTSFKLVYGGNKANGREHKVTVFSPLEQNLLEEALKKTDENQGKNVEVDFALKYQRPSTKKLEDVTSKVLLGEGYDFPYKLIPVNLSKNYRTCQWYIKKPGKVSYEKIKQFPIEIDTYGPVTIKLVLDNNKKYECKKQVVAYATTNRKTVRRQP